MRLSVLVPLLVLVACPATNPDPTGKTGVSTDSADTAASGDTDTDTDSDTDTDLGDTGERLIADGEVSWNVDFGPDSEAAGKADCAYTRHYTGAEDRSAPWLCPACDFVLKLDVEMTAGREDCYSLVSSSDPPTQEYLGYADGAWYRAAGTWLSERGAATVEDKTFTVEQDVPDTESGGDYAFAIRGSLALGHDGGDPYGGYVPPATYACGWPKADPAPYAGDYAAAIGETLPDGVFTDLCTEPVRLHDFAGDYLVVDISATDCGPCQQAASKEEAFIEDMATAGVPVHVATLLAPSLSDTAGTPTHEQLQDWADTFGLTSPVLADRVWGLSVVGQTLPDTFGYPTFVVVSPSLEVLDVQVGFGSWDNIQAVIEADRATP